MRPSALKIAPKDRDGSFAVLSGWSHSKLRLKNLAKWVSDALWEEHRRLHPKPAKAGNAAAAAVQTPAKLSAEEAEREAKIAERKAETVKAALAAIAEYRKMKASAAKKAGKALGKAPQPGPSDPNYKGLGPAFLKWMFGGSCKAWKDKSDFAAMPSRVAQGAVDELLAELAGWAAKRAAGDASARRPGYAPDSRLPSVGFQPGDLDFKRRPDEADPSSEWICPALGTRGRAGKAAERVAFEVRLPEAYAFKKLLAVRFKPVGGCVDTGRRTAFGKKIFEGVLWEMHLVFDLDEDVRGASAPASGDAGAARQNNTAVSNTEAIGAKATKFKDAKVKDDKAATAKAATAKAAPISRAERFAAKTAARKERKELAAASKDIAGKSREAKIEALKERVRAWKAAGSGGEFPIRAAGIDPGVSDLLAAAHSWAERSWTLGAGDVRGANSEAELKVAMALGELSPDGDGGLSKGKWSKEAAKATVRRNRKVEALCKAAAGWAAGRLAASGVEAVFIGEAGAGWKDGIAKKAKLDRQRRRRFQRIPHEAVLGAVERILESEGVLVFRVKEAYTSASSFADDEPLPELGKTADELRKDGTFGGRRVSRGLFASRDGLRIQADVNGAANIMRKGLSEAFGAELSGKALLSAMSPKERAEWTSPVRTAVGGLVRRGQDEALKAERRAFVDARRKAKAAARLRVENEIGVKAGAGASGGPRASKPSAGASSAREKQAPGGSTLARAKAARKLRLAQRKAGGRPAILGPVSEFSGLGPRPMAGQESHVEEQRPSS